MSRMGGSHVEATFGGYVIPDDVAISQSSRVWSEGTTASFEDGCYRYDLSPTGDVMFGVITGLIDKIRTFETPRARASINEVHEYLPVAYTGVRLTAPDLHCAQSIAGEITDGTKRLKACPRSLSSTHRNQSETARHLCSASTFRNGQWRGTGQRLRNDLRTRPIAATPEADSYWAQKLTVI